MHFFQQCKKTCNIFLNYLHVKWWKENTFFHKGYKSVLRWKSLDGAHSQLYSYTGKMWGWCWWLTLHLRSWCASMGTSLQRSLLCPTLLFHSCKVMIPGAAHALSRPHICSEPHGRSDKIQSPGEDSIQSIVWKVFWDLQTKDKIATKKLCISVLRSTWFFALQTSHFEARWTEVSDF